MYCEEEEERGRRGRIIPPPKRSILCGIVSAAHLEVTSTLSLRPFYYIVGGRIVVKRDPRK